jgi:hypothetical protein
MSSFSSLAETSAGPLHHQEASELNDAPAVAEMHIKSSGPTFIGEHIPRRLSRRQPSSRILTNAGTSADQIILFHPSNVMAAALQHFVHDLVPHPVYLQLHF